MYGLPDDFDGAFFLRRELEVVSFANNAIVLYFDGDISLTIESSYTCEWPGGMVESNRPPVADSRLMGLVGAKITSVMIEDGSTLALTFDERAVVRCLDDQKEYESYRISHDGNEIYI